MDAPSLECDCYEETLSSLCFLFYETSLSSVLMCTIGFSSIGEVVWSRLIFVHSGLFVRRIKSYRANRIRLLHFIILSTLLLLFECERERFLANLTIYTWANLFLFMYVGIGM